jgi:hypothetical protein
LARFEPGQRGAPFALIALGVVGDDRALPSLQPKLPQGNHLRWAFDNRPEARPGFPWYGFYLLRRVSLTTTGQTTCAASQITALGLAPGTLASPDLVLSLGTFHSDQNLKLTDDFPAAGALEVDLSGRSFMQFRMDPAAPKRRVDVTLGFVSDFPPLGGGGGTGGPAGGGGPGGGLGDSTTGTDPTCGCGCGQGTIQPFVDRVIALGNGQYRATFGYVNGGSTPVSVPVGADNRFFPDPTGRGQPTLFLPGRHAGACTVDFDGRPITWTLTSLAVTASAANASAPGTGPGAGPGGGTGTGASAADGIVITAFRTGVAVASRVVSAGAGAVVKVSLEFDAIDEIRLTSGPVRLIDVCAVLTSDGIGQGWSMVPGFPGPGPGPVQPQAMLLPVQHPNYPLQVGGPDVNDSLSRALPRIRYGFPSPQDATKIDTTPWTQGTAFSDLFQALVKIVQTGPPAITDFVEDVPAAQDANDPTAPQLQSTQLSNLDLLLTAAVNPAAAQMLGLYWVDDQAVPGTSYDYMLVGDYKNAANGNASTILSLVAAADFSSIDAYVRIGVVTAASPSLAPPAHPRGYALPVTAVPPGVPGDAAGLVGLLWDVASPDNGADKIDPTESLLFHVWRKDFGRSLPPSAPGSPDSYALITSLPIAPGRPRTDDASDPERFLTGWPKFDLFAVDGPLVEGWYGYRISGIDIFGRYSGLSEAAVSLDIATEDIPASGTFDPAVHLIDATPPPAPVNVRAWVLDPQDPFVLQDAVYTQWRSSLDPTHASDVGLRVRWVWTGKEMQQAPDAKEFRVYIQPGSSMTNANIAASWQQRIAVVGLNERIVSEAIVPVRTGAPASMTGAAATAVGAVVTLGDGGPLDGIAAAVSQGVEIELPAAAGSRERFTVTQVDVTARTITVDQAPSLPASPSVWTLSPAEIRGNNATASGVQVTLVDGPPLDGIVARALELDLPGANGARKQFSVVQIDVGNRQVTLDEAPQLAGASSWALGVRERTYELFLPPTAPALATPAPALVLPATPSLTTPVAYGLVGVSAVDDKPRDDLRPASAPLAQRAGNEGAVSGPATVYQVWRTVPAAPQAPTFPADKLSATRADFLSRSFFMLHFVNTVTPQGGTPHAYATHVFRALDQTLFMVDAKNTSANRSTDVGAISAQDLGWLTPGGAPDNARRQAAANQVLALTPTSDYSTLTNDALRLLASLKSNSAAFTRLTNPALDPTDPWIADRVGPNEDQTYVPQGNRGAYLDTLDGRASNRYFYRTSYIDGAHNESLLGVSTPPVYLPLATIPTPPVIVDAGSDDKAVRLSWRSSADPDVAEYRVYRADTENRVARLLDSDRLLVVPELPLAGRSTIVEKNPIAAVGGKRFFYAVTAATAASTTSPARESVASRLVALSAFDDTRPAPPTWNTPQPQGQALLLGWTTTKTTLRNFLVQRRQPPSTDWQSISGWLPANARSFLDQTRSAGIQYEYRLLVIDQNGRRNNQDNILLI